MRRLLLVLIVLLSVPLSAQQPANCPLGGMVVSADNTAWACRGTASPPIQVTTGAGTASGTNTGDQTITLTGGVTGSGTGSFAATVVTNANLTGAVTSAGNATSYATAVPFSLGGIGACAATSATTGTMTVSMTTPCITITPTGACTFNATGGVAGQTISFLITTSGVSSFTLTWGTNYHKTGTLATGTTSARFFAVTFCYDGTTWWEISRTAVQT